MIQYLPFSFFSFSFNTPPISQLIQEEQEAMNYNPWGKPGAGAPQRDASGKVVANYGEIRRKINVPSPSPTSAQFPQQFQYQPNPQQYQQPNPQQYQQLNSQQYQQLNPQQYQQPNAYGFQPPMIASPHAMVSQGQYFNPPNSFPLSHPGLQPNGFHTGSNQAAHVPINAQVLPSHPHEPHSPSKFTRFRFETAPPQV